MAAMSCPDPNTCTGSRARRFKIHINGQQVPGSQRSEHAQLWGMGPAQSTKNTPTAIAANTSNGTKGLLFTLAIPKSPSLMVRCWGPDSMMFWDFKSRCRTLQLCTYLEVRE